VAQPFQLQVRGVIQLQPFCGGSSMRAISDLDILTAYVQRMQDVFAVVGATVGSPFLVPFGTLTKANFVALHCMNQQGSAEARITTALGTDQIIPFSGGWILLWMPSAGEEITAIKLIGTADIEVLLAGS
jgi:hypothetical protein